MFSENKKTLSIIITPDELEQNLPNCREIRVQNLLHVIASAEARTISYAKASFWDRMGNGFSEMVQMEILLGLLSNFKSR